MLIAINYRDLNRSERLDGHVRRRIGAVLRPFGERLTRVEVHIGDQNGRKPGEQDKRVVMEARPAGHQPIAVEARAADLYSAVSEAGGKLRRALERRLRPMSEQRS